MRTLSILLLCVWCSAATCDSCEAGGFFRRVPEVGEWARYEMTQVHTSDPGKPTETSEVILGSLVLKCVGEELIDERRFLWIESCFESKPAPGADFSAVTKYRVPEDGLVDGTLAPEDVRGWQRQMKFDPVELTIDSEDRFGNDCRGIADSFKVGVVPNSAQMSNRTIVVNDEEVELTYSETSTLPAREYEDDTFSGEVTIWPHDDLAFGVASMDSVHRHLHHGETTNETLNETRFDLVATGTDDVSELPDHN